MNNKSNYKRVMSFLVENRTNNVLHRIINNFVAKECPLLLTDGWQGYKSLKDYGYSHAFVNHKKEFVNPNRFLYKKGRRNYYIPVHT